MMELKTPTAQGRDEPEMFEAKEHLFKSGQINHTPTSYITSIIATPLNRQKSTKKQCLICRWKHCHPTRHPEEEQDKYWQQFDEKLDLFYDEYTDYIIREIEGVDPAKEAETEPLSYPSPAYFTGQEVELCLTTIITEFYETVEERQKLDKKPNSTEESDRTVSPKATSMPQTSLWAIQVLGVATAATRTRALFEDKRVPVSIVGKVYEVELESAIGAVGKPPGRSRSVKIKVSDDRDKGGTYLEKSRRERDHGRPSESQNPQRRSVFDRASKPADGRNQRIWKIEWANKPAANRRNKARSRRQNVNQTLKPTVSYDRGKEGAYLENSRQRNRDGGRPHQGRELRQGWEIHQARWPGGDFGSNWKGTYPRKSRQEQNPQRNKRAQGSGVPVSINTAGTTTQALLRDATLPFSKVFVISQYVYTINLKLFMGAVESPAGTAQPVGRYVSDDRMKDRDKNKRQKTYNKKKWIRATSAQRNDNQTEKTEVSNDYEKRKGHEGKKEKTHQRTKLSEATDSDQEKPGATGESISYGRDEGGTHLKKSRRERDSGRPHEGQQQCKLDWASKPNDRTQGKRRKRIDRKEHDPTEETEPATQVKVSSDREEWKTYLENSRFADRDHERTLDDQDPEQNERTPGVGVLASIVATATTGIQELSRDVGVPVPNSQNAPSISRNICKIKLKILNRAVGSPSGNARTVKTNVSSDYVGRDRDKNERTYREKREMARATSAQENQCQTARTQVSDNHEPGGSLPGEVVSRYKNRGVSGGDQKVHQEWETSTYKVEPTLPVGMAHAHASARRQHCRNQIARVPEGACNSGGATL
jgi:hypothetical protein